MKLISIILPYYKKKIFIEKTINSVLSQTYRNYELILVYDDNDKKDLIFIKKLINKNSKIKIIVNTENLGVAKSRNLGVLKSSGDYICFIDADDLWEKNKLKIQLEFMKKNKCYISHTNYKIINNKGNIIGLMKTKDILKYKNLIYSCDVGLSTVMIDAKLKSKIKFPNIKTKEDFILWLKLSRNFSFYGVPKFLVSWRKGEFSYTYIIQKFKDAFQLYWRYEKFNFFKSLFYTLILSFNYIIKSLLQKFYK
jgi:teichuronic acid biosynthesis glycosyltransferase TuaG